MVSDEERREAVRELRCAATGAYRHVDAVDVIAGAIGEDVGGMHTHDAEKVVYAALADLIDPPTCAMVREGEGFRCSACGEYHDMSGFDEFPWAFCPECGARVIDREETDGQ